MNFEIIANELVPPIPLLVHVPHSSTFVLPDLLKTFSISEAGLQRELLHITDWYTGRLFEGALELSGTLFINRLSRLVVDPERFPDDSQEVMAAKGMGAVYTNTFEGRALRRSLTAGERNKLLDTYFVPYAQSFTNIVAKMLETHGRCYILDGHSFPFVPLPYELDQRPDRPDICVGTDQFHTFNELTQSIKNLCSHTWLRC
jgi:N-formylglutamate deformylase